MKKCFAVLCLSVLGVTAFAQVTPLTVSAPNPQAMLKTAVERQVFRAQAQAVQPDQTSAKNRDGHQDIPSAPVVHSDRPSYYADEQTYQICSAINICDTWARNQTKNNVHFQVLSAQLSLLPDAHNQRLEVRYIAEVDEKVQVFEEYFGSWKQLD